MLNRCELVGFVVIRFALACRGTRRAGTAKLKPLSSKAASSASDPPAQRVTAASSILAGDPARAAAAAAFTQDELDALAEQNIKPWDPEARAALKVLFPGHD